MWCFVKESTNQSAEDDFASLRLVSLKGFPNNCGMMFDDEESMMYRIWESVEIRRGVSYSLFTFGESELPYFLVTAPGEDSDLVTVRRGEIKVARPMIITPQNARPEFQNFFEDDDGEQLIRFLMARTAAFSNLKLSNHYGSERIVSDSVDEVVSQLNRQLDREEEDRVAILVAPEGLTGVALLKYATERITQSAPDNLQELRERGFLPE